MVDFRTLTIAREFAEEEAEDAYDALSEEMQELREEVAALRRRMAEQAAFHSANYRAIMMELERLRGTLG